MALAAQAAVNLGACMESKDTCGATPLFLACENNKPRIVQLLAASGAKLSTGNRSGEAPLYIAALRGHVDVVQTLLAAFAQRQISWLVSSHHTHVLSRSCRVTISVLQ